MKAIALPPPRLGRFASAQPRFPTNSACRASTYRWRRRRDPRTGGCAVGTPPKRLNGQLGADMRAITIIILAIASGLAYAGLIEGIVKFATLIP